MSLSASYQDSNVRQEIICAWSTAKEKHIFIWHENSKSKKNVMKWDSILSINSIDHYHCIRWQNHRHNSTYLLLLIYTRNLCIHNNSIVSSFWCEVKRKFLFYLPIFRTAYMYVSMWFLSSTIDNIARERKRQRYCW